MLTRRFSVDFTIVYVHIELNPEKQLKIKSAFFLNRVNISANQMIIGNSKGVNNRHIQFGSIQVQEWAVMDNVLIWLPHRKCIVKILIGRKYYVKHLNKKILKCF